VIDDSRVVEDFRLAIPADPSLGFHGGLETEILPMDGPSEAEIAAAGFPL
jgi:hypothetical protein